MHTGKGIRTEVLHKAEGKYQILNPNSKETLMGYERNTAQPRFLIHFYLFLMYSELIGARGRNQ